MLIMINLLIKVCLKAMKILNIPIVYKSIVRKDAPWAFISYIPEAMYRKRDIVWLNGHQSRREMPLIVKSFNDLGYNAYVVNTRSTKVPKINFDIVFGIEPIFEPVANANPNAVKIYYATGAYWGHQNKVIKERTDLFNVKYKCSFPYQRLVTESERCIIADGIIQIGSKYTRETYPQEIREKVKLIRQSSSVMEEISIYKDYNNKKDFLWLGSVGAIFRGLDVLIDFFKKHPEKTLHIVGPVEETFKEIVYSNEHNIRFYGYMNTSSDAFKDIANKCNYMIYPSWTEGGCPGSVLNAMRYGIIPITSKWAAFDGIEGLGYLLKQIDEDSICEIMTEIEKLSSTETEEKSIACANFAKGNYTLDNFYNDFTTSIKAIIDKK